MYKSKVYQPAYHLKENFMLYNFNGNFFSYFELFKSYGGLKVISKVWIVKILSNFKRK